MDAKKIYLLVSTVLATAFPMAFTAAAVYRITIANLLPYQLILVGTALEVAILIFETPTGVIADMKSRKLSVLIGLVIIALGFIVEASFSTFIMIALAQVIWGLGYTFISGALDAWVSDETDNESLEKTLLSGAQLGKVGAILGVVLAMGLGSLHVRVPLYVAGLLLLITSFFLLVAMPEKNFSPEKKEGHVIKNYLEQMREGLSHIWHHPLLKIMLMIILCFGLYSEGIDRLYELFILDHLDIDTLFKISPILLIGGINIAISIGGFLLIHVVKQFQHDEGQASSWIISLTMMMALGIVVFAYGYFPLLSLSGFLLFRIMREGTYPLLNAIQLRNTPAKMKATVLSTFSQMDAVGQLMSGPLMVTIAGLAGVKITFLTSAGLLILAVFFLSKLRRKIL